MRRFQSHKLVARLLLCPENTGSERTPISSVIEGIADEDLLAARDLMVDASHRVVLVGPPCVDAAVFAARGPERRAVR